MDHIRSLELFRIQCPPSLGDPRRRRQRYLTDRRCQEGYFIFEVHASDDLTKVMEIMPILTERYIDFIKGQQLFFVATAAADGRVNVSPKGMDTLRVLEGDRIVWLNLSGSGNETAAHLAELDRITLMFCAFEGHALILRVYGRGRVIHPRDAGWDDLIGLFPQLAGSRQIIDIRVESAMPSCGSGVPKMQLVEERGPGELLPFYEKMGEDGVRRYWEKKNQASIDGKPTHIFPD